MEVIGLRNARDAVGLAAGRLTHLVVRLVRRGSAHVAGRLPHTVRSASPEGGRTRLQRLADEQGALLRVATLVAQGVPSADIIRAVAREMGCLLGADYVIINRYEPDRTSTVVGHWRRAGIPDIMPPLGGRWPIDDGIVDAAVARTGRPARFTDYARADTEIGAWTRARGIKYAVACPIMVQGRLWGFAGNASSGRTPQPADTEERMLRFMALVGTAIANAETRAELLAARARVVAASDAARRRFERDLHDGAQQRLICLGLELRAVEASVPPEHPELKEQLARTAGGLTSVLHDLQEISHGLYPAALTQGGLDAAVRSLARRSPIPVKLDLRIGRQLAEPLEAAAYYTVSEALTNALKHAHASEVDVVIHVEDETVRIAVDDDGVGGADFGGGSGLIGLRDRVEPLGGDIRLTSPPGEGTSLLIRIPLHYGTNGYEAGGPSNSRP
ncbi:GAF domain-containing protein [Actinoallomurus oryzae]|uniref:histidine kinase n=1 Tax=Actinoallomurus oryzae TaxID=502180 RepID=A0ABP8Q7H7_9ACTN